MFSCKETTTHPSVSDALPAGFNCQLAASRYVRESFVVSRHRQQCFDLCNRCRLWQLGEHGFQIRIRLDANGNTIQIDSRFFDHNDLNRFWRYRDGTLTVTYTHNAFGERQIKDDGSTVTRFVYSGPNLLHEQAGVTNRDYIYLHGEMVGMVKDGVLYAVHNDHLGRPEVVTDTAKATVWSGQNNAFGNTPETDLIGNFNVGFPGQYYDIESGTHYNYFRSYDGQTGRYLESDPIGLSGGLNAYGYVGGNPLSYTDPLGLEDRADTVWEGQLQNGSSNPITVFDSDNGTSEVVPPGGRSTKGVDWDYAKLGGGCWKIGPGELDVGSNGKPKWGQVLHGSAKAKNCPASCSK